MTQTVGLVGLGVLGSAIARVLVENGFDVLGYDIAPERLQASVEEGVRAAASPAAILGETDILMTCVPKPAALMVIVEGPGGVLEGGRKGQILVELSTLPVDAKEAARDALAPAGIIALDVPVSGNRIQALEGGLSAFASGDEDAVRKVEPVLEGFTKKRTYVGDFGNGMKMKFCGNVLNLVHNVAAAEVMVLGMKAGLDPKLVHRAISGSASSSGMFETRGGLMADQDYAREGMNFSTPIKDRAFITEHAAALNCPMPLYHTAVQYYLAAMAQDRGHLDASAVCEVMAELARADRPEN